MAALLPCPFCGSKDVVYFGKDCSLYETIGCMGCGLEVYIDDESVDEKLITELWNNRAKYDQSIHNSEQLSSYIESLKKWSNEENYGLIDVRVVINKLESIL